MAGGPPGHQPWQGGGCILPGDVCKNIGQPVADVLRDKTPGMCVPSMENPTFAAFEEYEEVPETVPLEFLEEDVMWVASKLSGDARALGAEAIELRNWLLCFGYASEEFRVVVADMANWMANSYLPWAAYHALMACCLVVMYNLPGVCPIGIGEKLLQATTTACGSLQLCAGLEAGIERSTHAVAQRGGGRGTCQ